MPPPANQGSKGALVTWTVISTILFVTATVFAIYYYVDSNKVTELSKTNLARYNAIIDDSALTGSDVTDLKNYAGSDPATIAIQNLNPQMKILDIALAERNALAGYINSADGTNPDKAALDAKKAVNDANAAIKHAGGTLSGTTLTDAITALSKTLATRDADANARKADSDRAAANLQKKIDETTAQLDAMNKTIDGVRAEQLKTQGEFTSLGNTKDDQIKQLQTQADQQVKDGQDAQLKLQSQITDDTRKIKKLEDLVATLEDKLGTRRVDPNKAILTQPDGQIVRLPGGNTCFIDIGSGQQVSPGLTFEVYDKVEGVPPPGDPNSDENLPRGKASIEVIHVGATSSECRITRLSPGAALSEGDLIVNLVYDKNAKYKFMVFGNFDLARTGKPNPADAEVVKRLITQWGGQVVTDINVDTDFAVLGAEPTIPNFTHDDLQDPINKAKFDQANADLAAYDDMKGKAKELRIPILNQNRFLYFVGYYDQAKK